MSSVVNVGLRAGQIVFAAIVTGLSIKLATGHMLGITPVTLSYASFVGCVSLLAAFIGLAATWVEWLQGPIGLVVDGVTFLINLAGGVLIAVKLKGVDCSVDLIVNLPRNMEENNLMNGGWGAKIFDQTTCYYCTTQEKGRILTSRCKMNQADAAFMFLTVIVLVASLTFGVMRYKRGY